MNTLPFFKYVGSQWVNETKRLTPEELGNYMRLFNDALASGGYIQDGCNRADFDGILFLLGINESDATGRKKMRRMIEKFTKLGLLEGCDPTDENPKGYCIPSIIEGVKDMMKLHNARVKGGLNRWKNYKAQCTQYDKTTVEEKSLQKDPEKNPENSAKTEKVSVPVKNMPDSKDDAIKMMKAADIPAAFVGMAWGQLQSKGFRNQGDEIRDFMQYVQSYWNGYQSKHPDAYDRWKRNFPFDSEGYDLTQCTL